MEQSYGPCKFYFLFKCSEVGMLVPFGISISLQDEYTILKGPLPAALKEIHEESSLCQMEDKLFK